MAQNSKEIKCIRYDGVNIYLSYTAATAHVLCPCHFTEIYKQKPLGVWKNSVLTAVWRPLVTHTCSSTGGALVFLEQFTFTILQQKMASES